MAVRAVARSGDARLGRARCGTARFGVVWHVQAWLGEVRFGTVGCGRVGPMRCQRYILKGKQAIACPDLMEWAQWFETAERHVAQAKIEGVRVSTVFLGLDHSFRDTGPVILYETMVFGGSMDQHQDRYSTWAEAEAGHKVIVAKVRELTEGGVYDDANS